MWQQEKKDSAIASLALWLALATPLATTMLRSTAVMAETPPDASAFPLPTNVENGTVVRIDGSSSLLLINESLKKDFEQQFAGTKVEIATNGTEAALKALLDGKIEIAAIARELTPAEKAQGLEAISLQREKIAIVVGGNNPFKGSLTARQFAKIFRGEITDWSDLGAKAGKIRFIDQPATSDTRNALRDYPAFQKGEFTTGANAIQLSDNNTAQIIKQLDKDGISYLLANQVSQIVSDVRVLKVGNKGIDDPNYPFSQSLVYVYKQNPNPGVAAFLGFTSAQPGQKAIAAARNYEAKAIAASSLQSFTTTTPVTPITATTANTALATPVPAQAPQVNPGIEQNSTTGNNSTLNDLNTPWLMVLPLILIAVLGGFLPWWLLKRKRSPNEDTENTKLATENNRDLPIADTLSSVDNIESDITASSVSAESISNLHESANTDNLISSEAPTSAVAVLAAKKTNVVDNANNLETELSTLDDNEVVWDIEAPAAVVNNLYPQIPNRPEITFDIELSTDEFIGPASELTDELVEESISELNEPLSKLSDAKADNSNGEINSLSELLEASAQTNSELLDDTEITPTEASLSLSELLDASAKASTESSLSFSELLDNTANASTEDSLSLSELLDASAKASTEDSLSLSELLNNTAKASTEDSLSLSELLDNTAKASTEDSSTPISDLLNTPTSTSSDESSLSDCLDNSIAIETDLELPTNEEDSLSELPEELGQALDALVNDSTAVISDHAVATDDSSPPDQLEDSLPDLPQELGQALDALVDDSTTSLLELPNTSDETEDLTFAEADSLVETEELTFEDSLAELTEETSAATEELTFAEADSLVETEELTFEDSLAELTEETSAATEELTFAETDSLVETEELTFEDSLAELTEETSAATEELTFAEADSLVETEELTFEDSLAELTEEASAATEELTFEDSLTELTEETSTATEELTFAETDSFVETEELTFEDSLSDATEELTFAEADSLSQLTDTSTENEHLTFEPAEETLAEFLDAVTDTVTLTFETIENSSVETAQTLAEFLDAVTDTVTLTFEDPALAVDTGLVAWTNLDSKDQPKTAEEQEETSTTQAAELLNIDDGESNIVLTPRTPKWAYVSWYVSENVKEAIAKKGDNLLAVRLYDVTNLDLSYQLPQLVQQYECEEATSDRYVAIPTGNRDYIAEIGFSTKNGSWLCLARSSAIRVFNRPRTDFWFVTDTELVIHGATEPGAKVTIAGHNITVKTDGTFEVRVPFLNDAAEYQLTATAPTGGTTQTIVKKFSQETH